MSNEIVKANASELDAWIPDWANDGANGFETVDSDCVSMPYVKLAQATSDQAKKGHAKYIPGLEAGMYYNSNSGKRYGGQFIVLGFIRQFVEYDTCGMKANFVRVHTSEEYMRDVQPKTTRKEFEGKTYTVDPSNGHSFVDTRNFFVLAADAPEDGVLVYSHRSSGIGASKKWLSAMSSKRIALPDGKVVRAPIYTHVWAPRIELMTGDGNSWHQYAAVDCVGPVPPLLRSTVTVAFNEIQDYIKAGKRIAAENDVAQDVSRVFGAED